MDAQEVDLLSICKGASREVFERELSRLAANLADVNTSVKEPRRITLTFIFTPFPDRSGYSVTPKCRTVLADLDCSAATSTVYLARRPNGQYALFSRDLRQELLFDGESKSREPERTA